MISEARGLSLPPKAVEAVKATIDLNRSHVCLISKSISKPTSELIFSRPFSCSSCHRNPKFRVRVPQALDTRKSDILSKNGEFTEVKENLFKWVGTGVLGFGAAVSICCDSPASTESLTFAFPVSRTREVNTVQRTLVEAWGLIGETFVDPTFNHQDWDLKLQQTMVEMFPLRSEDAAYNKVKGMFSSLGDPFTRLISPKEYQSFRIGTDGNLQGVGLFINVEPRTGHLVVSSCVENGPAARAGIHEGDELIEIMGKGLRVLEVKQQH